ncbi:MAG: GNAT family N-acetyltransferase, partial [Anaeroplasmataceae bacterium]|nr:GNAT family N-acetyltransferase [Anaeroplasmataceae bacterium]
LCVIDLIVNYPKENTAFLGFFMLEKKYQGKGIASGIFQELSTFLKSNHFNAIRLGYVKGNQQSEFFWKKNGFLPVGLEVKQPEYTVVVLEKKI